MLRDTKKKRFTDVMVERMRPPKAGRVEIGDAVCPGLLLRVTEHGVKSFSVIYKVIGEGGVSSTGRPLKGKQRRITLGQWPTVKVSKAREQAQQIVAASLDGEDPRQERRAHNLNRAENTVKNVADRFLKLHAKPNVKSWKNIDRIMRLHVLPSWKDRSISDVRRGDVHQLLDDLVSNDRAGTAREVRKHLSSMFNWAVDREIVVDNPVFGLTRSDLKNTHEAGRSLSDDEIKAIWAGAKKLSYPFGDMYRLLMLTGQRRNEWAEARLSELNSSKQYLEVPKSRYKGNRDHVVPLPDLTWRIVDGLPSWGDEDDYFLFTTTGGKKPVSGFSRAKSRLDEYAQEALRDIQNDPDAKLTRYRVHDFRVTCETRLATLGFNQEVRDAVLGHAKPGLQKTYNKHDYLEEKSLALGAYEKHLMEVIDDAKS